MFSLNSLIRKVEGLEAFSLENCITLISAAGSLVFNKLSGWMFFFNDPVRLGNRREEIRRNNQAKHLASGGRVSLLLRCVAAGRSLLQKRQEAEVPPTAEIWEKIDTTENNRIFGYLQIDRKPKLQQGWEVILENFMVVKSVKFLW